MSSRGGVSTLLDRRDSGYLPGRPPFGQSNLIWAFDPDLVGAAEDVVGPAHTLNNPVRTAGPPGFYTFAAADAITFGDSLDTIWTGTLGWTIYACINPSAGDIAAATELLVSKNDGGANQEFYMAISTGKPAAVVIYGNNSANNETAISGVAFSAAKHVHTVTFDPSKAFGTRLQQYKDGAFDAQGASAGIDGTIADSAAILTQGLAFTVPPVSIQSYIYAYRGVQSAGVIAANVAWIRGVAGKNWI